MLSAIFVTSGIDVLLHPGPRVEKARQAGVDKLPFGDAETLTRVNACVQIGSGVLLATNHLPRLASLALIGSLLPTTYAGHPFWAEKDKAARKQQQTHFLKNLAIAGGLLVSAADTGGRESVPHRLGRAGRRAQRKARKQSRALPVPGH